MLWYRVSKPPVLLVLRRDPEGKQRNGFFFTTGQVIEDPQAAGGPELMSSPTLFQHKLESNPSSAGGDYCRGRFSCSHT
ncbi:MAG TPA: hypothetical protein VMW24_02940 [Sedimentisphaerales bacterium]|nr:hypothetical protein [Sedimentisphaerales bacterium]